MGCPGRSAPAAPARDDLHARRRPAAVLGAVQRLESRARRSRLALCLHATRGRGEDHVWPKDDPALRNRRAGRAVTMKRRRWLRGTAVSGLILMGVFVAAQAEAWGRGGGGFS